MSRLNLLDHIIVPEASDNDIKHYQQKLGDNVHNTALPVNALLCRNSICSDVSNQRCLIVTQAKSLKRDIIPFTGSSYNRSS